MTVCSSGEQSIHKLVLIEKERLNLVWNIQYPDMFVSKLLLLYIIYLFYFILFFYTCKIGQFP